MQDSEKVLTQAEIDALLSGGTPTLTAEPEAAPEAPAAPAAPPPPEPPQAPAPAAAAAAGLAQDEAARLAERLAKLEESVGQLSRQDQTLAGMQQTIQQLQQTIQELTGHLQTVSVGLQGTIGFAARDTFVCNSCSTQGNVAARLTCTTCGTENWWGWYPQ